jgi:putative membrane protein
MDSAKRPLVWVFPTVFLLVWAWAAWKPMDRFDWMLENLLVFLGVPVILWLDRKRPFSTGSLALLTLFLCLHVIGSHWTYALVPGPWAPAGGRNSFDRIVHLAWGLLLAPVAAEALVNWRVASRKAAWLVTVLGVLATSAVYEIVEMVTALIVAPGLGDAFLGTQGDPFDAVKDMAMAWLGSLMAGGAILVAWLGARVRAPARPA